MPTKLLLLGLDSVDCTLLDQYMAAGKCPHLAAFATRAESCSVDTCLDRMPGAIWSEYATGRSCAQIPLYFHPKQLRTGEAELRRIEPDEVDGQEYFWAQASAAGRHCAIVDPVQAVPVPNFNGIQLFEWGLHDRTFTTASEPPSLLEDIRQRFGDHPVRACDLHGRSVEGYRGLRDNLRSGLRAKQEFAGEWLQKQDWDLFFCTFAEGHCAGHQFWHFQDPDHPWHDANAPEDLAAALGDIYIAIDEAVGAFIDAAGADAKVIILASHGMNAYTGGFQLLPELLNRMGLSSAPPSWYGQMFRRAQRLAKKLPRSWRGKLIRFAKTPAMQAAQEKTGSMLEPFRSAVTRAAVLPNNRVGAIRVNLKGREPFGPVAPGKEYHDLLERIREAVLALRHAQRDEPIVARVERATEAFGEAPHADVPDLVVEFREDLGILDGCRSPHVGDISVPLFNPYMPRSGEHTSRSRLWYRHPASEKASQHAPANALDLAPTVLQLLDVPIPTWIEGQPLNWIR